MTDETESNKPRAAKKRTKKKDSATVSKPRQAASKPREASPATPAGSGMDPARRNLLLGLGAGVVLGAVGGFFGGKYYGGGRAAGPPRKKTPLAPAHIKIAGWSARKGPNPAKVTLVEFTDFQCPFCSRAAETLRKLHEAFKDDLALVLMHRPLEMHKHARIAAIAAQAAQRQGKAWELHDKMFENRKELDRDALIRYAGELGLDVARFTADLDNPEVAKEVDSDNATAESLGATGTPAFFINGRGVRGARPIEEFEKIVEEERAEANKLIEAGTPLAEVYDKRCQANVAAGPPKQEG